MVVFVNAALERLREASEKISFEQEQIIDGVVRKHADELREQLAELREAQAAG